MNEPRKIHPVFTWRSALCDSDLPPTARHVALTVSVYMNERGGSCHPGGALLAHDTGLSLRTVRTALATLEEHGWLVVLKRGGASKGGKRMATDYQAAIPPTVATPTPVQQLHACNEEQGPVQLTTTTGAPVAPQFAKNLKENLPIAPTAVGAVDISDLRSAVFAACGIDPERVTPAAEGGYTKAINDLARVGAVAADVPAAAHRYGQMLSGRMLTPSALARHWAQLHSPAPGPVPAASEAERFGISLGRSVADHLEAEDAIAGQFDDPADRAAAMGAWERTRRQAVPA